MSDTFIIPNVDAHPEYVIKPTSYIPPLKQSSVQVDEVAYMTIISQLSNDGMLIRYISNPDEDMCMTAVKQNGLAIQYIKKPSLDVCLAAIDNDVKSFKFIDTNHSDYDEICWYLIKTKSNYIEYIKDPSDEMILESIKNSSSNIQYMTTKQRESDEFIKEAIKTNPYVIRWIEQTYELCMFALNIDVTTIGCVHSEIVDMYMVNVAVSRCPTCIRDIDPEYIPYEKIRNLLFKIMEEDPSIITLFPEKYRTDEICQYAIRHCSNDDWKHLSSYHDGDDRRLIFASSVSRIIEDTCCLNKRTRFMMFLRNHGFSWLL